MLKKYLNCCLSVESGCWTKLLPTVALQIHGGEFLSSFFQRYVPSHVVYCVCMDGMDPLDWISAVYGCIDSHSVIDLNPKSLLLPVVP